MAPRKILLLGATGASGIPFIRRAIASDITVLVYARTPSKLPADLQAHALVTVLPAAALDDAEALNAALALKPDAVVSLLGPAASEGLSWMNPFANKNPQAFADAYRLTVDAMKAHGVRRIFALGTFSIPDARDGNSLAMRLLIGVVWALFNRGWRSFVGIGKFFDTVDKKDIDWTIFRVGLITDGGFWTER